MIIVSLPPSPCDLELCNTLLKGYFLISPIGWTLYDQGELLVPLSTNVFQAMSLKVKDDQSGPPRGSQGLPIVEV